MLARQAAQQSQLMLRRLSQRTASTSSAPVRLAALCAAQLRQMPLRGRQCSTWDGTGSQGDLMHKDECVLVNEQDAVLGAASKFDAHRFVPGQPHGRLHRAFSVFLFNAKNELLLQQRAASKITFPDVWTNTCCSHPLHGHTPSEVDRPEDVASGAVPGAQRAALRKLRHELGIAPEALSAREFRFLTRLHYCAPDRGTYGPDAEWGEHEVDYILFARADVAMEPNPDEVQAVRYVDAATLRAMMAPESGLRWSPWFRIIAKHFLDRWWADLDRTLGTDDFVDVARIHKLQC